MKEKEIIDKLKELQNNSFEWSGGEDLIDFIKNLKKENEELQKENEELREITNGYNSLKKDSETFGGIPLIIADEKYFNEGIFTTNFIPKDKIKEIIKEELPDDDICKSCGRYDVNGVVIKQKLIKVLEEE